MAMSTNWFVIINPTSGNGSGKRKWPIIKQLLESNEFKFSHAFTEYATHSRTLAENAVKYGFRNIICLGGDGTLHNVLNGIMNQSVVPSDRVTVGVIPVGTGNDWVRSFGISRDFKKAVLTIKSGRVKTQDIGRISFADPDKDQVYFMNISGIGFDGYVVSRVEKYKMLGPLAYLFGAIAGILSFKNFKVVVTLNSQVIQENALMVLIGLGRYSGGGMQLTKDPDPFDGFLDVSIAKDFNNFDILKNLANLFNGKIVSHYKVSTYKASTIQIEVDENVQPYIQADGELLSGKKFSITSLPKKFCFYCD